MNRYLKTVAAAVAFVSIIIGGVAMAESAGAPQKKDAEARAGGECGRPPAARPLTDGEKTRVAHILSKYKASSLTAADARAINEAFREAGFVRGAGLRDAIEAAGFDPERISSLYPPPGRRKPGGEAPPRSRRPDPAQ